MERQHPGARRTLFQRTPQRPNRLRRRPYIPAAGFADKEKLHRKGSFSFAKRPESPCKDLKFLRELPFLAKKYPYLCFRDEIKEDIARMYKNYGL